MSTQPEGAFHDQKERKSTARVVVLGKGEGRSEHKDHQVLPLETAPGKGKAKLQEARAALATKGEEFPRALGQARERESLLQEDEDTGMHSILSECGEMLQMLKDEEELSWPRLKEESRTSRVKLQESKAKLPQETHDVPPMA